MKNRKKQRPLPIALRDYTTPLGDEHCAIKGQCLRQEKMQHILLLLIDLVDRTEDLDMCERSELLNGIAYLLLYIENETQTMVMDVRGRAN